MPFVYYYSASESAWISQPLEGPTRLPGLEKITPGKQASESTLILPGRSQNAAILTRPEVPLKINGHAIIGGLRVLGDRDEIRLGSQRFYYVAQDPLAVEPYRGSATPCPRCSAQIEPGTPAARCLCGTWFHESSEQPCFTYGESCPTCGGSTELEGLPWDPSSL